MSLYQKYRAKSFSEILTQKHVTEILQASIKTSSFGHAYLFVGTRGTGKTSLARIFARAINCQNVEFVSKNGEPCNECESCVQSLHGSSIDIIEMDAASNRGIDEVRSLKEAVDFLPSIGKYKVYIIDEAHMMTKEAFNALLKTIEEPPKHIVFIMCTTESFKLPATIVSRSQVFELKHATIEEIVQKIDRILISENVSIDDEGKKLIAKLGKGSFRDTESILEKVLSSNATDTITIEQVTEILGLSSALVLEKAKKSIYEKNLETLQDLLETDLDDGSINTFNTQIAESIYQDIVGGLTQQNNITAYNFELFDFFVSLDKDLRTSINPKLLYIAKVLNFVKNYSGSIAPVAIQQNVEIPAVEQYVQQSETIETVKTEEELAREREALKRNPSAVLRQRSQQRPIQTNNAPEAPVAQQASGKFISKIDFLNYIKEKNSFLFRFFSHHEFQIIDGVLTVDVQKPMEQALLTRPQTIELINTFGKQSGVDLKVVFGSPKIDKRTTEEKAVQENKKTVADLSEQEIKDIFNLA